MKNTNKIKGLCCALVILTVIMFVSTVSYIESNSNNVHTQTAITAYNA